MSNLPIGYLIPTLLLAWCLYFILAPPAWPRFFKSLSSYFGVINELPFLRLFWLLSSTWFTFIEGDIYSPMGWLTFGLTLLVAGGLIVIIYRGIQDAPAVSRALDEHLKQGWRHSIDPEIAGRLRKKFPRKALLGPFIKRPYEVERIANISYGNAGQETCWMCTAIVLIQRAPPYWCISTAEGLLTEERALNHSL